MPPISTTSIYENSVYLTQNPDWHVGDSPWKAKQILRLLQRHDLQPNSICEVGCGAGQVLVELQQVFSKETQFFGYEISSDAFNLCQPKANARLQFKHEDLACADTDLFDLLLVLDVVEHVEDYLGFLRGIRGKADYKLFQIPLELTVHSLLRDVLLLNRHAFGHLHHFTKDTALSTLADCGYQIVDWLYIPAVVDLAKPSLKTTISNAIRRTGFWIHPDKSVLIFGGYALMVLAR